MKTLIFVRHGKSSWEYSVQDKDRPLKERGINDAYLVASEAVKNGIMPEAVFASFANRALHTCIIFLRTLQFPIEKLVVTPELYDFGGSSVQAYIDSIDNSIDTVMLFGHNHAFTSLANMLGDKYIENVPTSGMVVIDFEVNSWKDIKQGKTKHFMTPKQLK
ncbi:SixA phosphatase family protein [Sungkyunkwania multivorans]|uniref:SixA phosphatase family protein n=1 Tax=Sungkyunkwania multivorans TaxID=1173618 RepID=A0ABW3CXD7_9FLAO